MKRLLSILLSLVLVLTMVPGMTVTASAEESVREVSVPEGYTPVYDAIDLWMIRNDMAGSYILMNDIDLGPALASGGDLYNKEGWLALGYSATSSDVVPFTGIFDGNGYAITGLKCLGEQAGLIYRNDGTIK